MGEGWSDWYAKDFLVAQFPALDNPAVDGDVHMGTYTDATPNTIRTRGTRLPGGARRRPAARGVTRTATSARSAAGRRCTTTARSGPQTLWDLRKAIGSADAERLITQGMRLSPPEPSFLDERNAILAADTAAGGTFQTRSGPCSPRAGWATTRPRPAPTTSSPVEDFSPPPGPGGPARDDRRADHGHVRRAAGGCEGGARLARRRGRCGRSLLAPRRARPARTRT